MTTPKVTKTKTARSEAQTTMAEHHDGESAMNDKRSGAVEAAPSASDPHTTTETITPEMAKEMLKHANPNNRAISEMDVKSYAAEMKAGLWRGTHQGIAYGADGILYDGHHRLRAIIEADVAVRMSVTRGLSKEAIDAIDRGRVRKAHEIVHMADGTIDRIIVRAGCMAAYWLTRNGNLLPIWGQSNNGPNDLRAARAAHLEAVTEICDAFRNIKGKLSCAAIVGSLAICHRTSPSAAVRFAAELHAGTGYPEGSPVLALRNHMTLKHIASGAAARDDVSLRAFSAFDAYVRGLPRDHVKPSEGAREKYLASWRKAETKG